MAGVCDGGTMQTSLFNQSSTKTYMETVREKLSFYGTEEASIHGKFESLKEKGYV